MTLLKKTKNSASKTLGYCPSFKPFLDKSIYANTESGKKKILARPTFNGTKSRSVEQLANPELTFYDQSRQNLIHEETKKMIASFEEILLEPNYTIVKVLCEAELAKCCRDELFTSVVTVFIQNDLIVSLLKLVFRSEIQSPTTSTTSSTLLRGESSAIRLLSKYFASEGRPFLHRFVRPLIQKVSQIRSLEINPEKAKSGENVKENATKLLEVAQRFIDDICNNPSLCPIKFRHVFLTIIKELKRHYPDHAHIIAGSLLFLRYICPAITCPQNHGLESSPSPTVTRALILVSKLLQNLVNQVEFDGTKEQYMISLNSFITKNNVKIKKYFEDIVDEDLLMKDDIETISVLPISSPTPPYGTEDSLNHLTTIRNYIYDHRTSVWHQLDRNPALLARFKSLTFFGLDQFDSCCEDSKVTPPLSPSNSQRITPFEEKVRSCSVPEII